MASGSQNMTTYYAKRVIGDASAAQANSALLQTGEDVAVNTWILNRTNRATTYGIKYVYDDTDGHDKVEFYGGAAAASAWVQLDTGDITAHKFIGALEGNADTATIWQTARTLTIGNTGKSVNGSTNVEWSKTEIIGNGTTAQFLRGDHIWTNQLTNHIFNTTDIAEDAANLSGQATAHKMTFYRNGITIPYQMDNANDGGMIRVRGTSETTTIFELGTWDDSGSGETIQFNYYPTTSQVTPTYSVSVPKHSGTLVTTDGNGASGTWGISITGSSASCTGNAANVTGTVAIGHGGTGATTAANARNNLGLGSIATYGAATAGTKDTWGLVPVIGASDGVMEVGKYIDFHVTDGNTKDYDVRITAETTGLTIGGTTTGTFKGNVTGNCSGSSGSCTGNAATATKLAHTTLDSTTINNTAGSFAFSGSGVPWDGSDWVGLQIGDNADKFQISARSNTLQFRQNDSGGTNTSWSDWVTMLTSANYTSYTVTKTGSGASGTWGIDITGRAYSLKDRTNDNTSYLNYGAAGLAASAITWLCCWNGYEVRAISKAEMANATDSAHKWVRIGGDTITGALHSSYKSGSWVTSLTSSAITLDDAAGSYGGWICGPTKNGRIAISTYQNSSDLLYIGYGERGRTSNSFTRSMTWNGANGRLTTDSVANAVWNDIAESRVSDIQTPGYVIAPGENKIAHITTKRLQSAGRVISDTYGYLLGDEDNEHAPVAIAGRVLAYPLHDKSYYEVGDAVCAAEGGKIDKMTRDEIKEYPDRIIGIVNEIPDYDIWEPSRKEGGREPIHTNGRIWIDIR